jgi:plastocyanin
MTGMGRFAGIVAGLALLVASLLGAASPAQAAVKDIRITQSGPEPQVLVVAAGDTVRVVNADTFVHRVVSSSAGWAFDTGSLLPGEAYEVKPALSRAGSYTYRGDGLDRFQGRVTVPGAPQASAGASASPPAGAAVRPSPGAASASPGASGSPTASPVPASSPSPTGGTGSVPGPPPLLGGGLVPPSAPQLPGLPPAVAPVPVLTGAPVVAGGLPTVASTVPEVAAAAQAAAAVPVQPVVSGPLPGAPDSRRFGLPVVLALLTAGGVLSLLVRLLLAEPVTSREPAPARTPARTPGGAPGRATG